LNLRLDGAHSFNNKIIAVILKLKTKSTEVFLSWFKVPFQHLPRRSKW